MQRDAPPRDNGGHNGRARKRNGRPDSPVGRPFFRSYLAHNVQTRRLPTSYPHLDKHSVLQSDAFKAIDPAMGTPEPDDTETETTTTTTPPPKRVRRENTPAEDTRRERERDRREALRRERGIALCAAKLVTEERHLDGLPCVNERHAILDGVPLCYLHHAGVTIFGRDLVDVLDGIPAGRA